jgi:hypothetical protein
MTRRAPCGNEIGVRGCPLGIVSRDESNFVPFVSHPV